MNGLGQGKIHKIRFKERVLKSIKKDCSSGINNFDGSSTNDNNDKINKIIIIVIVVILIILTTIIIFFP